MKYPTYLKKIDNSIVAFIATFVVPLIVAIALVLLGLLFRPQTNVHELGVYNSGKLYQVTLKDSVCFFYVRDDISTQVMEENQKCLVIPTTTTVVTK